MITRQVKYGVATIMDIKEELLKEPEKIVEILEHFGFEHINFRPNEIRFARNADGGSNISMRLQNNEWCNISDYARGYRGDIFSFITQEKNVSLREVLKTTKKILGLSDDWTPRKTYEIFGGVYNRIMKQGEHPLKTYDESILNNYIPCGNLLWLNDGISLGAMRFYNVSFSPADNAIVFPWRSPMGEIISLKARVNEKVVPDGMSKYYYIYPNVISKSLFNYSESYEHLYGNDVYVFESEKSCMIAWSRGIKNTLAIGSNSLSPAQCKLLLQLQPKTIYLMLDSDLDLAKTKSNADLIKKYAIMRSVSIKFWDWRGSLEVGSKSSPMDGTVEGWNYILKHEIKDRSSLDEELTDDEI